MAAPENNLDACNDSGEGASRGARPTDSQQRSVSFNTAPPHPHHPASDRPSAPATSEKNSTTPTRTFKEKLRATARQMASMVAAPAPASRLAEFKDLNDPNDPLIWSQRHKWMTFGTICLFTFMANVNASCFTVAIGPLSRYFHQSDPTMATWLTTGSVLAFGLGNLFWIPMMRVVGKRPVYLAAILVLIVANIWSHQSTSWGTLLSSRIVSGLGAAAADATVPSVVFDLFALDERAYYLAWFHISLASGIFLGPMINAGVVQHRPWWWIPGWMAIVFGVIFVLAIFCIHETTYTKHRRRYDERPAELKWKDHLGLKRGLTDQPPGRVVKKALEDLSCMAAYPQVLFAGAVVGVFVGCTIIMQITVGQWFTAPPYGWPISKAGAFHLSGWIGAMFALVFGGWLLDLVVQDRRGQKRQYRWLATPLQNHLKSGPPRRLIGLLVPAILAPPGLLIFGLSMVSNQSWVAPAFGYSLHSFGFNTVSSVVVTYNVDCYRKLTAEAMVTLFIIRNIIAVIVSFYSVNWIKAIGARAVFVTMASMEWAVMLVGVAFYLAHDWFLGICEKFGPFRHLPSPPAAEGEDDHEMAFMSAESLPPSPRRKKAAEDNEAQVRGGEHDDGDNIEST